MIQRFPIGTTYTIKRRASRNKAATCVTHTVIDCHKTYNAAGELVLLRYVTTHPFAGQEITDYGVCDTEIARNNPVPPPEEAK